MDEITAPAMRRILGMVAVVALCMLPGLGAAQVTSQGPDPSRCPRVADPHRNPFECRQSPFDAAVETITGDWNGARKALQDMGITPTFSLYGTFFANGNGKVHPIYGGTLSYALNVDFAKLVGGPKGLSLYLAGLGAYSGGADSFLATNPYPVSANYFPTNYWWTESYLQYSLLDGDLTFAAGRLQPSLTFAFTPAMLNYVSLAFYSWSLGLNEPPFNAAFSSQWGAQGTWSITPAWKVAAGVYNNNPESAAGANNGFAWGWNDGNKGVFAIGQVSYLPGIPTASGTLPGQYTLGAYYDGNTFPNLGTGLSANGSYGFYAVAQQMVLRQGGVGSNRGLTLWGQITGSPRQDVNLVPFGARLGATWQGPIESRSQDSANVGWYYGNYSPAIPGAKAQQGLEVNYTLNVTRALSVIADFQGLFRVNGTPGENAFVYGLQVKLTF